MQQYRSLGTLSLGSGEVPGKVDVLPMTIKRMKEHVNQECGMFGRQWGQDLVKRGLLDRPPGLEGQEIQGLCWELQALVHSITFTLMAFP